MFANQSYVKLPKVIEVPAPKLRPREKEQYVINSKGEKEPVDLVKILTNIEYHAKNPTPLDVIPYMISQKVIASFKSGCSTSDLRVESVKEANSFPSHRGDYKKLACRLYRSDLHHRTPDTFSEATEILGKWGTLNDEYWGFVKENAERLDKIPDHDYDEARNLLSLMTFSQVYMLKKGKEPVERPQYTNLRVAVGLSYPRVHIFECRCPACEVPAHTNGCKGDAFVAGCVACHERVVDKVNKTQKFVEKTTFGVATEKTWQDIERRYTRLAKRQYIHASPTLFNIGTKCQQSSSCFLVCVKEDSVPGIYDTNKDEALISQSGGGIGVSVSNIRARGSRIVTTNGTSNGLVPMLKTYEATAQRTPLSSVYDDDPNTSNQLGEGLDEFNEMEARRKAAYAGASNVVSTIKEYNETSRYMDQCFAPGTTVYTQEGPKNIENVGTSDKVLSQDGTLQCVDQVVRHFVQRNVVDITLEHSLRKVTVTREHQILAIKKRNYEMPADVIAHSLDKGWSKIEFEDAGDLKKGDFLVFPIPKHENDLTSLCEDDCRFYGLLASCGFIAQSTAGLRMNPANGDAVKFATDYLTRRGVSMTSYVTVSAIHSAWSVANSGFKFVQSQLHGEKPPCEDSRTIHHSFLHLPVKKTMQMIKGIIEGAGVRNNGTVEINATSSAMAEQISYLFLRMGILASGSDDKGTVVSVPETAEIHALFSDEKELSEPSYIRYENYLLSRIKGIETDVYDGMLHDFEIEGSHTYTTHAGIAHNGGGKRKGAFAVYIEPWHADFLDVIDMKLPEGPSETRANDLFYAAWMNDVFMKRVIASNGGKNKIMWSMFCPKQAPGLQDAYGEEFERLYEKYESEGIARKSYPIWVIWQKILYIAQKTGTPYILHKDTANRRNNQEHIGTIRSSNLCCEIMEVTNSEEVAVCLTGDTQIITKNGVRRLDECDGQEVLVPFASDEVLRPEQHYEVAKLIDNGTRTTYKLELQGAGEIRATGNHKFLVVAGRNYNKKQDKYEWRTVDQLKPGDKIASPTLQALPGFDLDIAQSADRDYLAAGWCLGDGWQLKNYYGVCFAPSEKEAESLVLERLNEWHDQALDTYAPNRTVKAYTQPNGVVNWSSSKQSFMEYMDERFGFQRGKAPTKIIPEKIKKAGPAEIASFLSGLFSADGCVFMANGRPVIALSSASNQLLLDAQMLLRCFGIQSKVRFGEVKSRHGRFQGTLSIIPHAEVQKFAKRISFALSPEKRAKLSEWLGQVSYTNVNNGREYVTLVSKQQVGEEKVYDLALPKGHHFIANNVVVHNCNLASIILPECVKNDANGTLYFDFKELIQLAGELVENLNEVIDRTRYPIPEARYSNLRHRPIGIGIQGLADVFHLLKLAYDGYEAQKLNHMIFEALDYGALKKSCELAKEHGPYETYSLVTPIAKGSRMSRGLLVFDGLKRPAVFDEANFPAHENYFDSYDENGNVKTFIDWTELRQNIALHGVRNSLLIAPMPTASTSKVSGCNESFEPYTGNNISVQTLAGTSDFANKHLERELDELGLWTPEIFEKIVLDDGSVQKIEEIPEDIRYRYRTVWELSIKACLLMAHARGLFIDQSQSFNLYIPPEKIEFLSLALIIGFLLGLKTGMYYLFVKPQVKQMQIKQTEYSKESFTKYIAPAPEPAFCKRDDPNCIACQ